MFVYTYLYCIYTYILLISRKCSFDCSLASCEAGVDAMVNSSVVSVSLLIASHTRLSKIFFFFPA